MNQIISYLKLNYPNLKIIDITKTLNVSTMNQYFKSIMNKKEVILISEKTKDIFLLFFRIMY